MDAIHTRGSDSFTGCWSPFAEDIRGAHRHTERVDTKSRKDGDSTLGFAIDKILVPRKRVESTSHQGSQEG